MRGIYVHIPFCVRKCAYCDFYSVPAAGKDRPEFARLLVREMDLFLEEFPEEAAAPADTVYFGGGTPTVLGAGILVSLLAAIFARFPVAKGAETSVEANPGTVTAEDLAALRAGGFNRVSLGVQSFDPATLSTLGRIHGPSESLRAYRDARAAGFSSVGIDLIFGIPGQRAADWAGDVARAADCLPDHVSAYALAAERGTPLYEAQARGDLIMPGDDLVAAMYDEARDTLTGAGYGHYEISNFARPGALCRHNLKYWRRVGYRGFGPSAHGLLFPPGAAPMGLRTANPPSLDDYAGRLRENRLPWSDRKVCTPEDAWKESLVFGLRETAGVDAGEIENKWGAPPKELRDALEGLVLRGKLLRDGSRFRLPREFLFVSNEVLACLA